MKNRLALLFGLFFLCALMAFGGPADGTWNAISASQGAPLTLVLSTSGSALVGTADGVAIANGKVEGATIWFDAVRSGVTYKYKGTVSGTHLDLHETLANGTGHRALQFNHT